MTSWYFGNILRRISSGLQIKDGTILVPRTNPENILFYTMRGRRYAVSKITLLNHTDETMLLDITGISAGIYLLSVKDEWDAVMRVVVY